jgi:hypothetical protein
MFIRIQLLLFLVIIVFLIYWWLLVYHTDNSDLALRPETPTSVIGSWLIRERGLLIVVFELEYGGYWWFFILGMVLRGSFS